MQSETALCLFQVARVWNLGRKKMKVWDDGCSGPCGCWNVQNTLFTASLGRESAMITAGWGRAEKATASKPSSLKKKKKFFSLPVDKITDWHAKPIKYVFCKFRNEEKCYVKKNFYRCRMIVNVVKDVGLTPTLFFRGLLLAYIWNLCWPRIPHCSSKCNHFSLLSDLLQSLCFHQYLTAIPKDPI